MTVFRYYQQCMFDAPLSITQSQSREYEKNPILFPHLPHFLSLHSAFPSPSLPIIFSSYFPSLSIPLPFFILPFPFPSSLFVSPSLLPNPSLLPVRFHCSPLDFLPQQLDSIPSYLWQSILSFIGCVENTAANVFSFVAGNKRR